MTKCFLHSILLLVFGMMVGGCGTAYYEEIGYYDPNWATDGRIIAVKSVIRHRTEGLPGYGRDVIDSSVEYIVSMKDDGNDEKIIYDGEGKSIDIPVASPLGNYIAYRNGQNINMGHLPIEWVKKRTGQQIIVER